MTSESVARSCSSTQFRDLAARCARVLRSLPPGRWLIETMKMMDRSVAVADAKTVGRRDRRVNPGLGIANRGFHVLASGEAGGDRRRQRAAGAVGVFGGGAGRCQRGGAAPAHDAVAALAALSSASLG